MASILHRPPRVRSGFWCTESELKGVWKRQAKPEGVHQYYGVGTFPEEDERVGKYFNAFIFTCLSSIHQYLQQFHPIDPIYALTLDTRKWWLSSCSKSLALDLLFSGVDDVSRDMEFCICKMGLRESFEGIIAWDPLSSIGQGHLLAC
ncbi:hypothetical protein PanWU01x14_344280 [Parasponia andersonii]|uniref:Uncharacterized protein n=1 Tax=Parasponia andersonii TaxID=3476 RepID=A0A2P5AD50_PARAD|nr:hypothetical protein PanWU01x14_344280 [Parasponia andersonii]